MRILRLESLMLQDCVKTLIYNFCGCHPVIPWRNRFFAVRKDFAQAAKVGVLVRSVHFGGRSFEVTILFQAINCDSICA